MLNGEYTIYDDTRFVPLVTAMAAGSYQTGLATGAASWALYPRWAMALAQRIERTGLMVHIEDRGVAWICSPYRRADPALQDRCAERGLGSATAIVLDVIADVELDGVLVHRIDYVGMTRASGVAKRRRGWALPDERCGHLYFGSKAAARAEIASRERRRIEAALLFAEREAADQARQELEAQNALEAALQDDEAALLSAFPK